MSGSTTLTPPLSEAKRRLLERRLQGLAGGVQAASIPRLPPGAPRRLSFAQERLWLLDRLEPGSSSYNVPIVHRLRGGLHLGALLAVPGEVARRQPVLAAPIREGAQGPIAAAPEPLPEVPVVDLTALDLPRRRAEADRLVAREARRPFDLTRGPQVRVRWLALARDEGLLVFTAHHVAFDGASEAIFESELRAIYRASRAGLPPPPGPTLSYTDVAAWQRERWERGELAGELAWWVERLDGLAGLELPADRTKRPGDRSPAGRCRRRLSERAARDLEAVAREEGTTPFAAYLAAYVLLLGRLTGRTDLAVGIPAANRDRAETRQLIGLLVNTLAVRVDWSGSETVRELVRRVGERLRAARGRAEVPFEKVVEALRPDRAQGRTPLVQAFYLLDDVSAGTPPLAPGVEHSVELGEPGEAKFDLGLWLRRDGDALTATLEHDAAAFEASTARRWLRDWASLVERMAQAPERAVRDLPPAGPERHRLLYEWNDTPGSGPRGAALGELVAQHAARLPDRVALVEGDAHWTYHTLLERSGRLAGRLRERGVGAGSRVAILLERSAEFVIATLATVLAGGAYVPIDPRDPDERVALLLGDSGPQLLLTSRRRAVELEAGRSCELVSFEELAEAPGVSIETGGAAVASLAPVYVMYTSGSTGRPKGVSVPHHAVARLVREPNFARLGPETVFLLLAPTSFDASTLELWGALANGGRLVVFPGSIRALEELGETLIRRGVSLLWLTAGLFHQMVDEHLEDLAGVRQLLAGGDVLSPPHVETVLESLPGTTLVNGYGPTENTTFTCCHPIDRAGLGARSVPVGRPISGTTVFVVDGELDPVPVGATGELVTGGDGLAHGYAGRPAATAERFVPDPFSRDGGRLYRTGDLARHLADGRLEFLGRRDRQIKVRGFRIEPGEVEAALGCHPAVGEAVVLGTDDRLTAYVVPAAGSALDVGGLGRHLEARLPRHLVPDRIVPLDRIPLTALGKSDRDALERIASSVAAPGEADETAGAAPGSPVAEILAALFADVLGLERVGADDDFFALGGHSLLATRVVTRIRRTFAVEVPLATLFAHPTPGELAVAVDALRREDAAARPVAEELAARRDDASVPLSFAQQRLWYVYRLDPTNPVYNVPWALELEGELAAGALERALGEILERHEALRTRFVTIAGETLQEVAPATPVGLVRVDLRGLPEAERPRAADAAVARVARRPFDLTAEPLLRATLVELGSGSRLLVLSFHHIAFDGWSGGVLVRDLEALYGSLVAGRPAGLAPLAIQYPDFAAWQRREMSGERRERHVEHWRRVLEGQPSLLALPADRPRPAVQRFRGGRIHRTAPPELAAALDATGRRFQVTSFMALSAVFGLLLGRHAGAERVVLGTPVANRLHPELERLVGFFANTLLVTVDLSASPSFAELFARVRAAALEAYDHQDLPFEVLVEELRPERDPGANPLFQTMLAWHNLPLRDPELPGLRARTRKLDKGTAMFDLWLSLHESEAGLEITFEHDADRYDRVTAERLLDRFLRLLEAATGEPEALAHRVPLLAAEERRQLLSVPARAVLDSEALRHLGGPAFAVVLDEERLVAPEGVAGELFVAGEGEAIDEPRQAVEEGRLRPTGRWGERLADGRIRVCGTAERVLRFGAVRLPAWHVEEALERLPGVDEATLSPGGPEPGEPDLVLFLGGDIRREVRERALARAGAYLPTGAARPRLEPAEAIPGTPGDEASPRDLVELRLVALFERILERSAVGLDDDFFQLGGSSLAAVRLVLEIDELFGCELALASLVEGATVRRLARTLREEVGRSGEQRLVELGAGGAEPPLVCVHPVGGTVLAYLPLARALGEERSLVAVQAAGVEEDGEPLDRVEAMAERYLEALRGRQERGPYLLGGWSMGGFVAYEMARRLTAAGERVARVVLIDSRVPGEAPEIDRAALLAAFADDLARSRGLDAGLDAASLAALPVEQQEERVLERLRELPLLPAEGGDRLPRRLLATFEAGMRAALAYRPAPYDGAVTLFTAADAPPERRVDLEAWRRLAGDLRVEPVPGDHYGVLLGEGADILARRLAQDFRDALSTDDRDE